MVNLDTDGYTKTLNHWKMQKKQQTTENQKNIETKINAKGGPGFYI